MKPFFQVAWLFSALTVAAHAAVTTITWQGSGSGVGSGTAWDAAANWSTPASFNSASTSLDFSDITTATVLSAAPGTTPESLVANNIYFGNTASPASAPNITLNGDGTAGDVMITLGSALNATAYVYVGTPGSTTGTSPIDTLGSDLTLNLGTGFSTYRYFGNYLSNTNASGVLAGRSVLLLNSKIIGTSGGAFGQVVFNSYSAYDPTTNAAGNAATVLTNNGNTFDAPISLNGFVSYTSVGNVGAGASALGAPSTVANGVLGFSNGAALSYIGSGDRSTDRNITWGGSIGIANDASTSSTLTFTGTLTDTSTTVTTSTMHLGASTGNTLVVTGTIADSATPNSLAAVAKDTSSTVTTYYDSTGTARTSTNTGTVILKGANTYTGGTSVSAGSLLVANTSGSGTGTGNVTVSSGGTFGGTGIVAPTGANKISVASGGFVSPGGVTTAIGTLTLDGAGTSANLLTLATGAKFAFDLGASNASDLITFLNFASGDLTLNSTAFAFSGAQAGSFLLFQFYSDSGTSLVSSGLSAANFNLAGSTGLTGFTSTLDFSTTGDIYLNVAAVPEPSAAWLLGGAALLLVPMARRRARC